MMESFQKKKEIHSLQINFNFLWLVFCNINQNYKT